MRLVRISVKIQVYIVIVYSCVVHMVAHFGFSRVKLRKCGVLPSQVCLLCFSFFFLLHSSGAALFRILLMQDCFAQQDALFLVIVVVFMSSLSP